MNKLAQTITGWVLLIAGLIIIGMALYSSFNVLTGQQNPPQVFEAPPQTSLEQTPQVPSEAKRLIQQKLKQMMPLQNVTHLMNLVSWSLLAGLFIFGGSKISALGIRLVKS